MMGLANEGMTMMVVTHDGLCQKVAAVSSSWMWVARSWKIAQGMSSSATLKKSPAARFPQQNLAH
jgi:ABC-type polar amino acid transport system ATPase subunit